MKKIKKFWNGKRVLLTGGAGFLGKVVAKKLEERGCERVFIPKIEEYDLTNKEAIVRAFNDSNANFVIHLAAVVGGIGANRENPGKYFYDNIIMGVNLIEQARIINVNKIVLIGTICAYPKFTPIPFKENNLWMGYPEETNAPYGLAKKMLLVQAQAYRTQYGLNAIYLLPVNLYGPGDNFNENTSHVIPALIKKCVAAKRMNKKTIVVWGTGKATREFLYVEDAAQAIVLASERYNGSDPVNIGSGFEISIKKLVTTIVQLTNFKGKIIWDKSKPDGQPRRCLDVTRAKKSFGFKAKTDFLEGLKKTVEWFEKNG